MSALRVATAMHGFQYCRLPIIFALAAKWSRHAGLTERLKIAFAYPVAVPFEDAFDNWCPGVAVFPF
jgi:hypothetical protein